MLESYKAIADSYLTIESQKNSHTLDSNIVRALEEGLSCFPRYALLPDISQRHIRDITIGWYEASPLLVCITTLRLKDTLYKSPISCILASEINDEATIAMSGILSNGSVVGFYSHTPYTDRTLLAWGSDSDAGNMIMPSNTSELEEQLLMVEEEQDIRSNEEFYNVLKFMMETVLSSTPKLVS